MILTAVIYFSMLISVTMPCFFSFVLNLHCFVNVTWIYLKKKIFFFFCRPKNTQKFVIVISFHYITLKCATRTPKKIKDLHFAITDHFQRVENKSRTKIVFHCCQFKFKASRMNCVCLSCLMSNCGEYRPGG